MYPKHLQAGRKDNACKACISACRPENLGERVYAHSPGSHEIAGNNAIGTNRGCIKGHLDCIKGCYRVTICRDFALEAWWNESIQT